MSSTTTDLASIIKAISNSNVGDPSLTHGNVEVVNKGKVIIIPEGMTKSAAREWLKRQEEAEEKVININLEIECYPTDGLVALFTAIEEIYGFATLQGNMGFFGPTPPQMLRIKVGLDENGEPMFKQVTTTKLQPPKFEGGSLQAFPTSQTKILIQASVKAKFRDEIDMIHRKMLDILKNRSIYKGKAIDMNLSFLTQHREFHPINDAPDYMPVSTITKEDVIVNKSVSDRIEANILTLIEKSELCKESGVNLKHGCLLVGQYGTGKTLTGKFIARVAQENGWTFIYLRTIDQLAAAIQIAKLYAPAVLFAEDFDQVSSGDRDEHLNTIMNTLDGIDTKDTPLITILTSNHPEKIQPGCLRPGRIDSIIEVGLPEADTAVRFLQRYGGEFLKKGEDLTEAGKAVQGYVPAFIAEIVKISKRVAINRMTKDKHNIIGEVTADDIISAAHQLKAQREMVDRKPAASEAEEVAKAVGLISKYQIKVNSGKDEYYQDLDRRLEQIESNI